MRGVIGLLIISLFLLGSCDVEREPPRPGPYGDIESETLIFML